MREIAPGVAWSRALIANVYFVGEPGQPWMLVDTGLTGLGRMIRHAASQRYGAHSRPEAIVLTHGHPDHSGTARELAEAWGVPVYVHPLERPFVSGESSYPPPDPTVGGFLGGMARFFPQRRIDIGPYVEILPPDGAVPGLAEWRWIHAPGHAPGQIALFREADRVLLAGDALTTINLDSLVGTFSGRQELARPPAPFTCDWRAARQTVQTLAELRPNIIGAGHGTPMTGRGTAYRLAAFADDFVTPITGRYVFQPAETDEEGIAFLPPPAPDPLPKIAAVIGLTALVGAVFAVTASRHRHREEQS